MRNDIEKMRQEFEVKIALAERENKEAERLEEYGLRVGIGERSYTQMGKLSCSIWAQDWPGYLSMRQLNHVLNEYPATEDMVVHIGRLGKDNRPYRLEAYRGYGDRETIISIGWIHQDLHITVMTEVDPHDPDTMQFLKPTTRELTDIEVGTYHVKGTATAKRIRERFPYYTWCCGAVTKFQGGRDLQTATGIITAFIENIKWRTFDNQE